MSFPAQLLWRRDYADRVRRMIRMIAPALKHPTNRNLADFRRYWSESHGPLYARTKALRRYVQHLTLMEAYGDEPAPTYDGASMFWFDDLESMLSQAEDPESVDLWNAVIEDDAQLFDRSTTWPTDHRKASVVGTELVVLDGATTSDMVKAIFISSRRPGLTLDEFSTHWSTVHGELLTKLPRIRRYVQTHALPESYCLTGISAPTHDGFAELWFDDYRSWKKALESRQWGAVVESGESLFARPAAYVVGRGRIQKG
jgi:uncharacterized protein (TIGR02118 family)